MTEGLRCFEIKTWGVEENTDGVEALGVGLEEKVIGAEAGRSYY